MDSMKWKDVVKRGAFTAFLLGFAYAIAIIHLKQQFSSLLDPLILGAFLILSTTIVGTILTLLAHSVLRRLKRASLRIGRVPVDAAWISGFLLFFTLMFARMYTIGIYPDDWFWSSPWISLLAWVIRLILYCLIALLAAHALAFVVRRFFAHRYLKIILSTCLVLSFFALWIFTTIDRSSLPAERTQIKDPVSPHVMIVGIDGLDYKLLQEFVAAGKMPNFEALMAEAAVAPLKTLDIASSPRIWATIATGRRPLEHGVLDHVEHRILGMKDSFFFAARTGANHLFAPLLERV
jgi:hypothetical protein